MKLLMVELYVKCVFVKFGVCMCCELFDWVLVDC